MARRRTMTAMSETEREKFVQAAVELHGACIAPMSNVRTDTTDYRVLQDLVLSLSDALGTLNGNRAPWHIPNVCRPKD